MPLNPYGANGLSPNTKQDFVVAQNGLEDVFLGPSLSFNSPTDPGYPRKYNVPESLNLEVPKTNHSEGMHKNGPIFKFSNEDVQTAREMDESVGQKTIQHQIWRDLHRHHSAERRSLSVLATDHIRPGHVTSNLLRHTPDTLTGRHRNNEFVQVWEIAPFSQRSLARHVMDSTPRPPGSSTRQISLDVQDINNQQNSPTSPPNSPRLPPGQETDRKSQPQPQKLSERRKILIKMIKNLNQSRDPEVFGSRDSGISSEGISSPRSRQSPVGNFHNKSNLTSPKTSSPNRRSKNFNTIKAWVHSSGASVILEEPENVQALPEGSGEDGKFETHKLERRSSGSSGNFRTSDADVTLSPADSAMTIQQSQPSLKLDDIHGANIIIQQKYLTAQTDPVNDNVTSAPENFNQDNTTQKNTPELATDPNSNTEDPEYLDSFSELSPLHPRRPSLWEKLRGLGPDSLRQRATTPTERTATSSLGYYKDMSSSRLSLLTLEGQNKGDRCQNCGEILQRAPPTRVAVIGKEKTFLAWILSKWGKRKELKNFGAVSQSGYLPHYCNFVRSKTLHGRSPSPALVVDDYDDVTDDGYITNTDVSPTDAESQRRKKKSSSKKSIPSQAVTLRKTATDAGTATENGAVRAHSPSSTGYDPESLFERLRQEGLAGSTSALNTTANVSVDEDLDIELNSEVVVEGVVDDVSRQVTTQTPVTEVRVRTASSPARQPIQIPSVDEKNKTADQIDSARSKTESDAIALLASLTEDKTKTAQDLPRNPPQSSAPVSKSKRTPRPKKEKGAGKERKPKGKKKVKMAEPQDESDGLITQVSEQKDDAPGAEEAEKLEVDVAVPDLPTINNTTANNKKDRRRRTTKSQIVAPIVLEKPVESQITSSNEQVHTYYDFGDLTSMTTNTDDSGGSGGTRVPPYLSDRMVLSLQSSRFELPMDMKTLEKMSPQDYLRTHCIISSRRKTLYSKMFQKYRERAGHLQGKSPLIKAMKDVLVNTITTEQADELCDLLEIGENTTVDMKLFSGVAALAERILYPSFVTEDTADRLEYQKEKVECADFSALDWKLQGIEVSGQVRRILQSLG